MDNHQHSDSTLAPSSPAPHSVHNEHDDAEHHRHYGHQGHDDEEHRREEVDQQANSAKQKVAMHVSVVTLIVNLLLSVLKLVIGLIAKSGALISDAIHSFSDVFSTIIVMVGVSMAKGTRDEHHQYGHERLEYIASLVLAMVLLATGLGVGYEGIRTIISGQSENLQVPGFSALIAAAISITVKEWMFWYTRGHARRIDSGALMADAWHHRSDAFSSIGALIGIWGARSGYPLLDPLASLVICAFIVMAAVEIFRDAINKLTDVACSPTLTAEMREIVSQQTGVLNVDDIKTRQFGSRVYIDVEIAANGDISLREAHDIAERVHHAMENHFRQVKHCTVHVNPYDNQHARHSCPCVSGDYLPDPEMSHHHSHVHFFGHHQHH